TADDVERLMAVNFFAPVYLTTTALPGMLERGLGAVVNVTSVAGYVPNPGESAYGAAKAALSLWSHGLAVDLHGTGVQVTVVSPGPIDTEIWSLDEELSYMGKLYPPQVVADAVADAVEKGWVPAWVAWHGKRGAWGTLGRRGTCPLPSTRLLSTTLTGAVTLTPRMPTVTRPGSKETGTPTRRDTSAAVSSAVTVPLPIDVR